MNTSRGVSRAGQWMINPFSLLQLLLVPVRMCRAAIACSLAGQWILSGRRMCCAERLTWRPSLSYARDHVPYCPKEKKNIN